MKAKQRNLDLSHTPLTETQSQPTPLDMLYRWEEELADKNYLMQPIAGNWHAFSWHQVGQEVRKMAAYLKEQNLPPQSHIAILSKNCAHWIMADLAIWMAGHVSIPLYPNLTAETASKILEHSEAKYIFVGKLDNWDALKPGITESVLRISFPYQPIEKSVRWEEVLSGMSPMTENPIPKLSDLATIIYTSGTTGDPKGVMHRFTSPTFSGMAAENEFGFRSNERFFSYLPLAHVAERLLVEILSVYSGGTVFFAESLELFPDNLRHAKPTIFLGVPRIWVKFQSGILEKLPQRKLDLLLSIPLVSRLIQRKIQKALGLEHAHEVLTGAAAMPESVFHWYDKLGIHLQEAYGMTENFALSHFTRNRRIQVGAVGQNWDEVDCRISDEGEVLVKSPATMEGYFKNPSETEAMFDGEYLKTGDLGEIDEQGFLRITGRAKDLFKTSKGKYVAPSPIEKALSKCPVIEVCCVVGDGLSQPLALVGLIESPPNEQKCNQSLSKTLSEVNAELDAHERLSTIVVVKDPWTIESGVLTPTLKIKRNVVEKRYETQLTQWEASAKNHPIQWEAHSSQKTTAA